LTINGNGSSGSGVFVQAAAAVTIENCVIQNFNGTGAGKVGAGITAQLPNSLQLNVTDTLIANNSQGDLVAGVVILPTGSGTIGFVFDRVRILSTKS
jgi:hypothetical protein